jgi:hypothetical protein
MKTSTKKSAQSIQDAKTVRNGGRTHEGRRLKRGDILYDRYSGTRNEFLGMTADGRVKVKGGQNGTRTIARSTFGANMTFSPSYRSYSW